MSKDYDYSEYVEPSRPFTEQYRGLLAHDVDALVKLAHEYDREVDVRRKRALKKQKQRFINGIHLALWDHHFRSDEFVELRPGLKVRSEPRSPDRDDGFALVIDLGGTLLRV